MKKKVAIIGGGPAGCVCAYFALQNKDLEIVVFDDKPLMTTILPTGNGRCNLAYAEFDFRELTNFYPRGQKFLYSVFSQFSTADTLSLFENLKIDTYMQDDYRFFPVSNSSKEVQKKFMDTLFSFNNFKFEKKKIENISEILEIYDFVVIATGSNPFMLNQLKEIGQKVIPFKQALVALKIKQAFLFQLAGVSFKNVCAKFKNSILNGDFLITHKTLSGPLIYKISSLMAFEDFPYQIVFNFTNFDDKSKFDKHFENVIRENNNKNFVNVISKFVPLSFAQTLLMLAKIDKDIKCHQVSKEVRAKIVNMLFEFVVDVVGVQKDGETVKAGGVDTDFINSKTMQSKIIDNLFVIGEILNVDGFCGGFNLQNCWSTGAICGKYLSDINS